MSKDFKRYMVTSALPYANGPVHIGHLAGVYVPSDIYVRYLRLRGKDVLWVCGSDEHGVPITLRAKKEGVRPQDIVDKYHTIIKDAFEEFGISVDIYSRTSKKIHYDTASEIFKKIYHKGGFEEKTEKQYYDPEAEQFLADRYITGTCPHCGHDKAYGDQCENCGTSLNATDLKNPKSTISGAKPELRETKHWYLPLDKHEAFLKKWILEEHKEWKSNVYGQCKHWIDGGLQARAVSRDLDWGVPVPVENADGKVLYVWFDAPIGYISATKEITDDWEKYWKDPKTKLVHFIGKDNIVFHCIIFPSVLKAEGSYILPDNVPANEFLNLEGEKISTSRNWAVWLHEYLREFENKQDVLRYVLTANAPENKDNSFTWASFQKRNNNELVATYGNFVNRALVLTHKYYNGIIPEPEMQTHEDLELQETVSRLKSGIEEKIENFKFREALYDLMEIARYGNRYFADNEPWKLQKSNPDRVRTIMFTALQLTARLAILSEPFLPYTANKLKKMLAFKETSWDIAGENAPLKSGHSISEPKLLFEKIEDKQIQYQLDKLKRCKELNEKPKNIAEQKENIEFESFGKMDIRTATILKAEKVAKTKKLLKLEVDTGIDTRTLVSGIAQFYKAEEIIGKKVLVLVNLKARKIRGIKSQGMILMAENPKGNLVFVSPEDKNTDNGSVVG